MSIILDYHNIKKLPNQSIAVIQCGLTICHAGHVSQPRIYNHYSAHFILEGKGKYIVNGTTYELGPGQGFMITPDISNTYIADEKEPWKYIYATFCGVDDDSLVRAAGLDTENVTFTFPLDEPMLKDLYAMYEASKCYDAKGYDVVGYFLLVMSRLIKKAADNAPKTYSPEHYLKKAISYIENNYPYNISVEDIAGHVGIDRSYLYKIFVKHLQQSPSNYLYEYRLLMGVKLLGNVNLSINEVALSVGFHDVAHFYKAFTAKYKTTPKNYRLTNYGED
ncbi:MAG: AraC family transcriptional regulator [Lachnospiraceae bacterium]|nr:AraC family transcriptional regulator [Lachnospiraceae bacterium]